jgi:hypothetical protein
MSKWTDHRLDDLVEAILADHTTEHHLGNQYLTAYQIALELEDRHPTVVDSLGMPRGGLDNRENTSLPQYIGRMLSQRILREGDACPIEGGFLSPALINRLEMSSRRGAVVSSVTGGDGISVYRLR